MNTTRPRSPAAGGAGASSPRAPSSALHPVSAIATNAPRHPYLDIIQIMLRCAALTKTYRSGGRDLTVLNDITFAVEPGGFAAIVGPSGSGKTTLLGLLAGLDRPTVGTVHLDGQELGALDEDARARVRVEKIGFVFQSFQLIPTLTALENVQVPLELRGEAANGRSADLLARVGLQDRGDHYP